MKSYKDLLVYRNSYKLAIIVHKLSLKLPKELKDIADQIRRCSRSIPTNIAEAYSRNKSSRDKVNFLRTALGSNDEMFTHLSFIKDLGININEDLICKLLESYEINGKRLNKLISFNKKLDN